MNKLSYKIIDEEEKITSSCPDFRIVIDDKETNHCFCISELEKSSKNAGVYTIVICTCGEDGCSGAEVTVIHQNNKIIWKEMWHTDYNGEDEEREFNFTENKIGHPSLEKKLPFEFDKEMYGALVAKLFKKEKEKLLPLIPWSKQERQERLKKLNKSSEKTDWALLWYLYNAEQIDDLTKEDKKEVNQWVRKQLKENPNAEVWEIDEDE